MSSELRYMLFSGPTYYPDGGFNDYRGSYESVEEAVAEITLRRDQTRMVDWFHVVDKQTLEIVREWNDAFDSNGGL